jgi:hypothetical protein
MRNLLKNLSAIGGSWRIGVAHRGIAPLLANLARAPFAADDFVMKVPV